PQRHDRVSLGRGTHPALCRDCRGARPAQGRCYRYPQHSAHPRGKAGDIGNPDRVRDGGRSGRHRHRRESGATKGGNVTGLSSQTPEAAGKRLELLREIVPSLRRLAFLAEAGNSYVALEMGEVQEAARSLRLEVASFEIHGAEDIAAAFEALKARAEALYVVPAPILFVNRIRINTLALAARLPTMYFVREYVEAGGLMSYGPTWPDMWRRAAGLVDKILRGVKPGDIPVEQP